MLGSLFLVGALVRLAHATSAADADTETIYGRIAALDFVATEPPQHLTTVAVGVLLEHLYVVDEANHAYEADFWLSYRWFDGRNYSSLFIDPTDGSYYGEVEIERTQCEHGVEGSTEHHARRRRLHERAHGNGRRLAQAPPAGVSAPNTAGEATGRHYLELGYHALETLWHPDLNIRNSHDDDPSPHSELIRLYDDGTVEQMQLLFTSIELEHPFYAPYPFDHQKLTVHIESLAHTTLQLDVSLLETYSGINTELVKEWQGWQPSGGINGADEATEIFVAQTEPHYAMLEGNEMRCERRARYTIQVDIERTLGPLLSNNFAPVMMIVVVSWAALFINVKVLMPRVAVGFISLLTLNNMHSSFMGRLPDVPYQICA